MAALGWLLNLGFAGGTAVVIEVPEVAGPEYTVPTSRLHYTAPDERIHYTIPDEDN